MGYLIYNKIILNAWGSIDVSFCSGSQKVFARGSFSDTPIFLFESEIQPFLVYPLLD